jgi:hypothetical protein
MSTPTMLYKHPGSHEIHGGKFDYLIVDSDSGELSDALDSGWFLTTTEAKDASVKPSEVAEYIENVTDLPKRGRPRKVNEVESIPQEL